MHVADAPPAGWYPDPDGGSRLRFWEGTDWSDRYRAPPTPGVADIRAAFDAKYAADHSESGDRLAIPPQQRPGGVSRADSEAIINQVRMAARDEAERAARMFGQEARSATSQIGPLISEYTSKFTRWIRIASTIAIVLLIGWLAFQIFAQVSLFDWIGDRIDNISDNNNTGVVVGLFGR